MTTQLQLININIIIIIIIRALLLSASEPDQSCFRHSNQLFKSSILIISSVLWSFKCFLLSSCPAKTLYAPLCPIRAAFRAHLIRIDDCHKFEVIWGGVHKLVRQTEFYRGTEFLWRSNQTAGCEA